MRTFRLFMCVVGLAGCGHELDPSQVGYIPDLTSAVSGDAGETPDFAFSDAHPDLGSDAGDLGGADLLETDALDGGDGGEDGMIVMMPDLARSDPDMTRAEADLAMGAPDLSMRPDFTAPDLTTPPDLSQCTSSDPSGCGGNCQLKCADDKVCRVPADCVNGACALTTAPTTGLCTSPGRFYWKITNKGDAVEVRYSFNGRMEVHDIVEFQVGAWNHAPAGVTSLTFYTLFQGKKLYASQVQVEVAWSNGQNGAGCAPFNGARDFQNNLDLYGVSADPANPCKGV